MRLNDLAGAVDAVREALRVPLDEDLGFSVCPGASEDTRAAKPAESAAAPANIHRLARDTRSRAASRSSAAREGLRLAAAWYEALIMLMIFGKEHHASVRAE
jgi:hypothetical protein